MLSMLGNARLMQGLFKDKPFKSYIVPLLMGGVALAVAVVGGMIVGGESGVGGINGFVEKLSGNSTTKLGDIAPARFGFAFAAGMVAAVNPCGFAMLPAYLSLYLGTNEGQETRKFALQRSNLPSDSVGIDGPIDATGIISPARLWMIRSGAALSFLIFVVAGQVLLWQWFREDVHIALRIIYSVVTVGNTILVLALTGSRVRQRGAQYELEFWSSLWYNAKTIAKALLVGLTVSAGFLLLFGAIGLIIGGGGELVRDALPWIGLIVGGLLVCLGAWMLSGGKFYSNFATQAASKIGNPNQVSIKGYFLFGLSYGIASLSCTLPIFLAVVGTSLTVSDVPSALGQMALYGVGMGVVIIVCTIGIAIFKEAMVGALRKVLPWVQPVSAVLMVVAGMYIVFYWLTLGRSLLGV